MLSQVEVSLCTFYHLMRSLDCARDDKKPYHFICPLVMLSPDISG